MPENVSGAGATAAGALLNPRTSIAGIGASAGGVRALQIFFDAMPHDSGAAFVVIAHLAPESRSELAEVLRMHTRMPVRQVTGTVELKPNCIYVIPPDRQLRISDDEISAIPFEEPRGHRMPIDFFFRSLAEHGDGFAIVLSGAGSDGAVGVKAIKEAGGIILVQDPDEAEYPPMPRAAIETGAVDLVLPLNQLALRLVELVRGKQQSIAAAEAPHEDDALRRILAHLRVRTGHDFSHYKRSTILRRIARRMQVSRKDTFDEYFAYMRENAEEAQLLLADLLISVTTFFRDSAAFESLAKHAIPNLFAQKDATGSIRVWVAGCATGEEAYSIGILFLEEAARQELRPEIQIFATDMDSRALATAREGRYPAAIEADVSEERLRRFFQRDGQDYRVKRELRDTVLFASHSLLKDPPFSRVDLISCRNLLIYLNRDLQQQVLLTFNYALNRDGYLFLGTSETAEHQDGLFRSVDREARLYQTAGRSEKPPPLPRLLGVAPLAGRIPEPQVPPPSARAARSEHREALETEAPPSIVVDGDYRIVHLSETAGRYLQPSGGAFTADINEVVREEIRFELRGALHRAFEKGEAALSPALMVKFNGAPHRLYVQVKPIAARGQGRPVERALILFIEGGAETAAADVAQAGSAASGDAVNRLRQELETAHSRLRTMREESDGANEELRAANEELQSINEEYRSTAEELETSKEELQSINEELQTVNSELKLKLDAVSRANSDLQNLMAATDFGVLFLDTGLRIKRFTPRTSELFNITQNDTGRPIGDFTHQLDYEGLADDAARVLKDLLPIEREVRHRNDGWYLARMRPYRTVEDKIDGVVATFVDITQRKVSEARLRLLLSELTHRVKNALAIVQGLVHQTARASISKEDFVSRLDGRLTALSESHDLLVNSDWGGADLRKLVSAELSAYAADPSRLRMKGEGVSLPPDVATPFGLVLHELATNAVKYGALSKDSGYVELAWSVKQGETRPELDFQWREVDGPPVKRPSSQGFGSHLIQKVLPGAAVKHEYRPNGVTCEIKLPLPPAT